MTDENKIKSQEPSTQSSPETKEPANSQPPFQYLLIPVTGSSVIVPRVVAGLCP